MPSGGFLGISREIIAEGIPLTVGEVALMAGLMVLNSAIIYTLGNSGMFIWSVCMEIFTLVLIAMSGVETSMISPQAVAWVFGARGADSIDTLSQALRIFSLSLVPIGVMNIMRVVFQLMGRRFASGALFTSQMLFMKLVIGAFAFFIPGMVWWGFPFSGVLMLAMMFAYTLYHHHRDKELSPFTLIPKRSNDPSLDFSVPYKIEALRDAMTRIRQFVASNPQMQGSATNIRMTCEEIMKNIIENGKGNILKWNFDVHLRCTDTQLSFTIKDAGQAFNPLDHLPQQPLDLDNPQLGIRIISSTCEKLSYKYMWDQNILLGVFHAK